MSTSKSVSIGATAAAKSVGNGEYLKSRFFVPGIQRAGGLQAALRLTNALHTIARFEPERNRPPVTGYASGGHR
jgi:hypothetical protein